MSTATNPIAEIATAYRLKQRAYQKSERELRQDFGNALRLDVIDKQAFHAWQEQWEPQIERAEEEAKRNNSPVIERYMHDYFYSEKTGYIPPLGFRDSFKEASIRYELDQFDPTRFDLAIWHSNTLCGLSYIEFDKAKHLNALAMNIVEGNPNPAHPLKGKIYTIIDRVSQNYAKALSYDRVIHFPPLSLGAKKSLQKLGTQEQTISLCPHMFEDCFVRDLG